MARVHPAPPFFAVELRVMSTLALALWLVTVLQPSPSTEPLVVEPLVVDVNHASLDELCALPGVGRKTAARIVAARPFTDDVQLRGVLGARRLQRLRPWLRWE